MGIRHLNRYIASECKNDAITKIHLQELAGKRIAVDASIYLYRFIGENRLIEQFHLLISVFRHYEIIPLFIFDGAAPIEKRELLKERRDKKNHAENKYMEIEKQLSITEDRDEKHDLEIEMVKLKKDFIRVKDIDNKKVKSLLTNSGICWVDAIGEADVLCAQLIHTGKVYACLSEDMDMFAYGCCRILRHISLLKHTVLMYDLRIILKQLKMTMTEFRQVLVISGTDYNKDESTNLAESIKWFHKYKLDGIPTFYEWLLINTDYIKNYDVLKITYEMFDVAKSINDDAMNLITINNGDRNCAEICRILEEEGFIFLL